jgi:hypothetical protein
MPAGFAAAYGQIRCALRVLHRLIAEEHRTGIVIVMTVLLFRVASIPGQRWRTTQNTKIGGKLSCEL